MTCLTVDVTRTERSNWRYFEPPRSFVPSSVHRTRWHFAWEESPCWRVGGSGVESSSLFYWVLPRTWRRLWPWRDSPDPTSRRHLDPEAVLTLSVKDVRVWVSTTPVKTRTSKNHLFLWPPFHGQGRRWDDFSYGSGDVVGLRQSPGPQLVRGDCRSRKSHKDLVRDRACDEGSVGGGS